MGGRAPAAARRRAPSRRRAMRSLYRDAAVKSETAESGAGAESLRRGCERPRSPLKRGARVLMQGVELHRSEAAQTSQPARRRV
uniref:Uncharacterized protein n=1 Tax=Zea mays TaxID=4577 RepID=C4J458_MAIZE|nr:unknown [Zea mays]ACR36148.1 unknown [Zea mays]